MGRQVLVLNADYSAISMCTVPKAFLLVYLNKAEMVAECDSDFLRTVSSFYSLPTIIRLHQYVNVPYKSIVLNRHNVFKRDLHKCQYCGINKDLTLDHVIPKSRGGKTSWDNLTTACKHCNSRKGDSLPEEAGMPLNQKPFRPTFVMFVRDYAGNVESTWLPYLNRWR
jgi:5-methylcytosine-specific restriction endonuclease McrA